MMPELPGAEEIHAERERASQRAWDAAERDLRKAWDRYSTYGLTGVLYRDTVIRPIHDRFNSGERSLELLHEIWSI